MKNVFKNNAIDVRGCTEGQKKWMNKLLAKETGLKPLDLRSYSRVEYIYITYSKFLVWDDEYNGDDPPVSFKEVLQYLNPYKGVELYIDSIDKDIMQRINDMGLVPLGEMKHKFIQLFDGCSGQGYWTTKTKPDSDYPLLTKEQFMLMEGAGEENLGKKLDAYIWHGELFIIAGNGRVDADDVDNAYKYNLISEDEFKAKYEDKLKFNDYKVIVEGDLISVGCLGFNKANIRTFQKVYHKIRKNGVDITKAYNWIVKHEKELGL